MVSFVFHMFAMEQASHLFLGEGRGGGGGGLAKERQNHAQEKREKKLVHKEAWENVYASLTYFWDLYNGNVRKKILIVLFLFERKVLNTHSFDLPDINQFCSHCRISVNLQ